MKNKLFIVALLLVSAQVAVYGMQGLKRSSKQLFKVPKQSHMSQSRAFFKQPNMQLKKEPVQDFKPVPAENKLVPVKNKLVDVDTEQLSKMSMGFDDKKRSYDGAYDNNSDNNNDKGYRSYTKSGSMLGGLFGFSTLLDWLYNYQYDIDDVLGYMNNWKHGFENLVFNVSNDKDRADIINQITEVVRFACNNYKKHVITPGYQPTDQVIIYEGKTFQGRSKEEKLFGLYNNSDSSSAESLPFVAIYKKDNKVIVKMLFVITRSNNDKQFRVQLVNSSLDCTAYKSEDLSDDRYKATATAFIYSDFIRFLKGNKFNIDQNLVSLKDLRPLYEAPKNKLFWDHLSSIFG